MKFIIKVEVSDSIPTNQLVYLKDFISSAIHTEGEIRAEGCHVKLLSVKRNLDKKKIEKRIVYATANLQYDEPFDLDVIREAAEVNKTNKK